MGPEENDLGREMTPPAGCGENAGIDVSGDCPALPGTTGDCIPLEMSSSLSAPQNLTALTTMYGSPGRGWCQVHMPASDSPWSQNRFGTASARECRSHAPSFSPRRQLGSQRGPELEGTFEFVYPSLLLQVGSQAQREEWTRVSVSWE